MPNHFIKQLLRSTSLRNQMLGPLLLLRYGITGRADQLVDKP